jgi:hypothetical protein
MVLKLFHLSSAIALAVSHSIFLFRGLRIVRRSGKPQALDRMTKTLSQVLLPITIVSGAVLLLTGTDRSFIPHGAIGLLPLVMILAMNGLRILFRSRKRGLRLLPVINLVLILLAFATGFLSRLDVG